MKHKHILIQIGLFWIIAALLWFIALVVLGAKPAERYYKVEVRVYAPSGRYEKVEFTINAYDSSSAKKKAKTLALNTVEVEVTDLKEIKIRKP